jgi:hypothetical protein
MYFNVKRVQEKGAGQQACDIRLCDSESNVAPEMWQATNV